MKIAIPTGDYYPGCLADYLQRAFIRLGIENRVVTTWEFANLIAKNKQEFDLYFCADSVTTPLNFTNDIFGTRSLRNVCYWFTNYRLPNSKSAAFATAKAFEERGGWVFHSQMHDLESAGAAGFTRCSWLPLAADTTIWRPRPLPKIYDLGFVGKINDAERYNIIKLLQLKYKERFGFLGSGTLWTNEAAALINCSRLGFNVSSGYGQAYAYDINMRFFETLACGVPIITNYTPFYFSLVDLYNINTEPDDSYSSGLPFVKLYSSISAIVPTVDEALSDHNFLLSGTVAREWIVRNHTYVHRIKDALRILGRNGFLDGVDTTFLQSLFETNVGA